MSHWKYPTGNGSQKKDNVHIHVHKLTSGCSIGKSSEDSTLRISQLGRYNTKKKAQVVRENALCYARCFPGPLLPSPPCLPSGWSPPMGDPNKGSEGRTGGRIFPQFRMQSQHRLAHMKATAFLLSPQLLLQGPVTAASSPSLQD